MVFAKGSFAFDAVIDALRAQWGFALTAVDGFSYEYHFSTSGALPP